MLWGDDICITYNTCTVELNVVGDRQLIEIRFQWHLINKGEQQCLTWTESSQLHMQQGRAVS
jgi:hypothetical protein